MVHQLVETIRKLLKHTPWFARQHTSSWKRVVTNTLLRATTVTDVLDLVIALEALVADEIGIWIGQYDLLQTIQAQTDHSGPIFDAADTMYEVYSLVAENARHQRFIQAGGIDMATVAANFTLQANLQRKARNFVEAVDRFVILSLLCASRSTVGARLVTKLAASDARCVTRIVYKEQSWSLLALTAGGAPYCQAGAAPLHQNPSLRQRSKPVIKGGGAGSEIGAPIWFDDGVHSAGELQQQSFDYQSVDTALRKILRGSLSFNSSRYPFYTPARIELLHELIHVLHNARGSNRVNVGDVLNDNEHQAWDNVEEYWTIEGGNITENDFNAELGLPARYGHAGLPLRGLDPSAEEAQFSLHTLSGF